MTPDWLLWGIHSFCGKACGKGVGKLVLCRFFRLSSRLHRFLFKSLKYHIIRLLH